MAEYKLYCFAESGNAYKVALMLALSGANWQPIFVDFFKGETRTAAFRETLNEMGEVPVLEHQGKRLAQTGVILTYLSEKLGTFAPKTADDRYEVLRWMFFDNHKFTSYFATYRFMLSLMGKPADPNVLAFLKGRAESAFAIVEKHLESRSYMVGDTATIADISMLGYLNFPKSEHGFDFKADYPHIEAWRRRFETMLGWKAPYDLLPRSAS